MMHAAVAGCIMAYKDRKENDECKPVLQRLETCWGRIWRQTTQETSGLEAIVQLQNWSAELRLNFDACNATEPPATDQTCRTIHTDNLTEKVDEVSRAVFNTMAANQERLVSAIHTLSHDVKILQQRSSVAAPSDTSVASQDPAETQSPGSPISPLTPQLFTPAKSAFTTIMTSSTAKDSMYTIKKKLAGDFVLETYADFNGNLPRAKSGDTSRMHSCRNLLIKFASDDELDTLSASNKNNDRGLARRTAALLQQWAAWLFLAGLKYKEKKFREADLWHGKLLVTNVEDRMNDLRKALQIASFSPDKKFCRAFRSKVEELQEHNIVVPRAANKTSSIAALAQCFGQTLDAARTADQKITQSSDEMTKANEEPPTKRIKLTSLDSSDGSAAVEHQGGDSIFGSIGFGSYFGRKGF